MMSNAPVNVTHKEKGCEQGRQLTRLLFATALTTSLGTVAAQQALAESAVTSASQEAPKLIGIDEIVVTATKRGSARIQDIPIAMQAITSDTLETIGVAEFADFANLVPSLNYESFGPGDKRINIRGVSSSGRATVSVYYDEANVSGSNKENGGGRQVDIKLYDLERIEVLRGPQGTLYGAGSMTGTIRYITNKPKQNVVEGYIQGEYSHTRYGGNNFNLNGMLNLPVVDDKLAVRLVGWINDNSGYVDAVGIGKSRQVQEDDINTENTEGGRVMVRFEPTERLKLTGAVTVQRTSVGGESRVTPGESFSLPEFGFPAVQGGDLLNTGLSNSFWEDDFNIYSGTLEYDADWGSFLATTNWFERDINYRFDSSPLLFAFSIPIPTITTQPQYRRIWSNEVRFSSNFDSPFQVVVGGFLHRERTNFVVESSAINEFGDPASPFDPFTDALQGTGDAVFGRIAVGSLNQEAIFGELSYDITDRLQVTVGGRYFHSNQDSEETQTHPFGGLGAGVDNLPPPDPQLVVTASKFTKKFSLSYQASEDALIYATAAEGFRQGGLNASGIPAIAMIPAGFGPDALWNYELGTKMSWLDNRLIINLTGYLIRWKDMQARSQDPSGAFAFIANAGKASIDGIELEVFAEPAPGLNITLGGSYQDARLTEDQPPIPEDPNTGLEGDRIPNVPKWLGSASVQYNFPAFGNFEGLARVDYSYRGGINTQFRPDSPFNVPIDSYSLVNLTFGITSDKWQFHAFAKNVFDKRAIVDAVLDDEEPLSHIVVKPRTIGLRATRRF